MAKQIKLEALPYIEPWWQQVGWRYDPQNDCVFSVSPDGEYERVIASSFYEMANMGIYIAPKWFQDIYPDWRDQIRI